MGEKYLEHIRSGKYFEDIEPQTCAVSIFVFTPAGDIKELAYGATPVDFAYAIHTDIGHATTGAKVNGKIVPLGSQLENGDVVEIMTDKNSHPSSTWLEFVATSKARQQISIEHKRRSGDRDRIIER